jgi:cytochrome P450
VLGHAVPKGTMVMCLTAHVGTSETNANKAEAQALDPLRSPTSVRSCGYWDEESVGEFKPERYLDANEAFDLKRGPNLAFGLGIRGCFGQKSAASQSPCARQANARRFQHF